ncbi:tetratricopeptide repeat protein [Streptomyces scabiei]|nr:tetratricopeptide repeat protein [Streptomyces scabiei]MDX2684249.1 tetratricopeptide repeat protein [Streptomyces scabiei]MDX2754108.1 tetratricopeptide repeat protein [Streptomyces scabiei]MDX2807948.1 tetratricopeptide repeat protein [Streptomyces scabiei]
MDGPVTKGITSTSGAAPFTGPSSPSRSVANSTAGDASPHVSKAGSGNAGEPHARAALPAVPAAFTGRDDDLARVLPVLDPQTESDPPVGICLVSGLGGIGKTSLALYAAHRAVGEGWFPGGALFIDFRGYDVDPLTTEQALLALLEGLGIPGDADVPRTSAHRYTRYQQRLAARYPTLLLFDNVSPGTGLDRLLPGTHHHRVLITSRYRLTDLDARLISLDSLQLEHAVSLVEKSLRISDEDDDRATHEPEAIARLAALCDRHPLALQIAVSMLRKHRYRPIVSLANELDVTANRTKTLGLQRILDTAYGQLLPDEARLFRLLSLAPRSEVSNDAAVVLADRDADRAAGLLADLASYHLVTPVSVNGTVRWRLHDMVREYGAKTVSRTASLREEGEAARERMLEFYRQRAGDAEAVLRKVSGRSGQTQFANRTEALAWLGAEWPSMMAAVQWCRVQRHAHGAVRLALALMDHGLNRSRSFDDWITIVRPACEAAAQLGDPVVTAQLWNSLGFALQQTGQWYAAMDTHTHALELYRAGNSLQGEAKALYNLGLTLLHLGQVEKAIELLTNAGELHKAAGNPRGEATTLLGLADAELAARRLNKAIAACTRAHELCQAEDDLPGQAMAWSSLGSHLQESMREREALEAYGTAARLYCELEDWQRAGLHSQWIARIHDAANNRQEARTHYLRAAEAFALAKNHDRSIECQMFADALT